MSDALARMPLRSGAHARRNARLSPRRRAQGHPQLRPRRLSRRMRASRRAPHRRSPSRSDGAQLIGFPGCYPSDYAAPGDGGDVHPSQCRRGAARLARLRGVPPHRAASSAIKASGRPAELLVIQECGGTRATIAAGRAWIEATARRSCRRADRADRLSDLVIGTKCGGSDGLSGITINPAVGHAFDLLVDAGRDA